MDDDDASQAARQRGCARVFNKHAALAGAFAVVFDAPVGVVAGWYRFATRLRLSMDEALGLDAVRQNMATRFTRSARGARNPAVGEVFAWCHAESLTRKLIGLTRKSLNLARDSFF